MTIKQGLKKFKKLFLKLKKEKYIYDPQVGDEDYGLYGPEYDEGSREVAWIDGDGEDD